MPFDWANFGVDLHLELDSTLGRRGSLERSLREAIRSGRLPAGSRLPSSRALASELNLARGTVSAAYDQLVAEGFLTARTGSGTIVAAVPSAGSPLSQSARSDDRPRYNLKPGSPDVTTFPTALWLRCARRALARTPYAAYDYGDPKGRMELRVALSGYLGRARGVLADPSQIVITSGYVQALALLARLIDGPIATEEPGLAFHRELLRYHGKRVLPMPVDSLGASVPSSAASLPSSAAAAPFPDAAVPFSAAAVVLTPAHQYPTGVTLHPTRRHAFVEWARATNGLIIEDDYDGEFRYDRQPVGALQGVAPDHVAYVGTAAKTLGPALRLAWAVLPPHLVDAFVEAKRFSDLHTESIGQLTLAEMVTSHAYDRHIRSCRIRYRHRRDLLVERLAGQRIRGISAGLHALVDLDPSVDEAAFLARAREAGLALGDFASHWHGPGPHPPGIVVGYGTPPERAYPAALSNLSTLL